MALWESAGPRRERAHPRLRRWPNNLAIVAIDTVVVRLLFPAAAVGLALECEKHRWGLLNNVHAPYWLAVTATFLALDLTIYLQHVMFHSVPALWRVHRMHHTDLDFDVTTGVRFHPIEIAISMLIKMAAVAALGANPFGVLIFEIALNGTSMFNHGNIDLPRRADRWLRFLTVTPDMHRVHHSIIKEETNSNFGFNLPWWDRLLGTYRAQPLRGHEGMTIGIEQFRDKKELHLTRMLSQPFRETVGQYPITSGP